MTTSHSMRGLMWLLAASLPWLAVIFAPGKSRASCGDYVRMGKHETQLTMPPADQPPASPRPCHGPWCQEQAPQTPVTPVSPPGFAVDNWANTDGVRLSLTDSRSRSLAAAISLRPIHRPTDVFHPPRCGRV